MEFVNFRVLVNKVLYDAILIKLEICQRIGIVLLMNKRFPRLADEQFLFPGRPNRGLALKSELSLSWIARIAAIFPGYYLNRRVFHSTVVGVCLIQHTAGNKLPCPHLK